MLTHALAWAHDGWNVFPLGDSDGDPEWAKKPVLRRAHAGDSMPCNGECGRDGHGAHDGTTDERTIRRWWSSRRKANIGANLGEDHLAVDLDFHKGADPQWIDRLPTTRTHLTGTSDANGNTSRHLIYRFEPGSLASRIRSGTNVIGPGVDIRAGRGSYIVMPPSSRVGIGSYTVADPAVDVHLLTDDEVRAIGLDHGPVDEPERSTPVLHGTTGAHDEPEPWDGVERWEDETAYVTKAVSSELQRLDSLGPEPGWDQTTFEVAATLYEFANDKATRLTPEDVDRLVHEHAPTDRGFTRRTVEAKLRSARKTTMGKVRSIPTTPATTKSGTAQQSEQDGANALIRVVEYAQQRYSFHRTPDGRVFAVPNAGIRRPVFITESGGGPLKSTILADLHDQSGGKVPTRATIERALEVLYAKATRLENTHELDLRVARRDDTLIIDLGQHGQRPVRRGRP